MNKTLQESFNRFLFLFGEAERIRRANITSSTKQLYWFSANQRRYAWRGNQRVETWCCRTNDLMQEIVTDTKAYFGWTVAEKVLRKHSIWTDWKDLTVQEFKAYLGVIANMALNDKPSIFCYFSADWLDSMNFFQMCFHDIDFSNFIGCYMLEKLIARGQYKIDS